MLAPSPSPTRHLQYLFIPLVLVLTVLAWNLVATLGAYPEFILPRANSVLGRFFVLATDGSLWRHASLTAQEALGGFGIGLVFATVAGYPLAKLPLLEKAIAPYLVASQSIPIVALAPLLVLWFGFGPTSKLLAAALISFFPILVNVIVGVRSVDFESRELMHTLSASAWDVFAKLEVPAALPIYLGGARVGITLSVIGAVVGEFVGATKGLGYVIVASGQNANTSLAFAAIVLLSLMSIVLFYALVIAERLLVPWAGQDQQ
jgi:NitT/TauT family transport system permease protein